MFSEVFRRKEDICNEYKIDGKTMFLGCHSCPLVWLYASISSANRDERADIDACAFVTNNFANIHSISNSFASIASKVSIE